MLLSSFVCNFPVLRAPQTTKLREQRLKEAVALHQFQTDASDMEAWIMETFRQVSSQEVGHDEFSTQTLARKQREIEEEIQSHRPLIDSLHEQAQALPQAYINFPQVCVPCSSCFFNDDMLFVVLNYCLLLTIRWMAAYLLLSNAMKNWSLCQQLGVRLWKAPWPSTVCTVKLMPARSGWKKKSNGYMAWRSLQNWRT